MVQWPSACLTHVRPLVPSPAPRGGKKKKTGTLETAKSVKHSQHKHEDLSSDPDADIKARQGVVYV